MPGVVPGAIVKFPLASIDSGPLVTGVTSVFVVVTTTPFIKSFCVTEPPASVNESLFAHNLL